MCAAWDRTGDLRRHRSARLAPFSSAQLPLTYARLGRPPLRPHSAAAAGLLHWPRWLATAEETRRRCPVWLDAQPERNFMLVSFGSRDSH
nr:unnamed protein product [Digitaria exilis]